MAGETYRIMFISDGGLTFLQLYLQPLFVLSAFEVPSVFGVVSPPPLCVCPLCVPFVCLLFISFRLDSTRLLSLGF